LRQRPFDPNSVRRKVRSTYRGAKKALAKTKSVFPLPRSIDPWIEQSRSMKLEATKSPLGMRASTAPICISCAARDRAYELSKAPTVTVRSARTGDRAAYR
jgi:hypothetical protein